MTISGFANSDLAAHTLLTIVTDLAVLMTCAGLHRG